MSGSAGLVSVLDLEPVSEDFLAEVVAGLSSSPRSLPCKFFYDERGAELFQKICELPEYYITRTETELLRRHGSEIAESIGANAELIGFGTGAGMKTRLLLEQLENPIAYVPVDISKQRLTDSAAELGRAMPALEILPVCADYLQPLQLPRATRKPDHVAVYFPGSTIGNLEPDVAQHFLRRVCRLCGKSGGLIIGVDLQKDRDVLEAAYNDSAGVTAEFNLNLLARANRELGADFDLAALAASGDLQRPPRAHRDAPDQRGGPDGSCRRQGISFFARRKNRHGVFLQIHAGRFVRLAVSAGFRLARVWTDPKQLFAVFHFTVAE